MNAYLLKDVHILNPTLPGGGDFEFYKGHILIHNGKIQKIFKRGDAADREAETVTGTEKVITIENHYRRMVFPGFIQSHIHFCQTLHRNLAEEMPLMEWLKKEIWPYEGNHTPQTMGKSVMMSLKEVLSCGTTAVLDMGTVHHQEVIFEIMEKVGFRYTGGKAMMDRCEGAPAGLSETMDESIRDSMDLADRFHGKHDGLLHYAFAPRFVLSCSTELLREVRRISDETGLIIHTHASEHPDEVAFIKETFGHGNIAYMDKIGALNHNTVIAHMVHLDSAERELIHKYNLSVAHCPTTNLKLGSGVAPICEYIDENVMVGLGADGAPCNNSLSIFNELKLAPLLQKGTRNNPLLVKAEDALRMISVTAARILRQDKRIGKIEENLDADLVLLNMDTPQTYNFEKNPAAALVYGADARNVFGTMVKGQFLYLDGRFSDEIRELDAIYR